MMILYTFVHAAIIWNESDRFTDGKHSGLVRLENDGGFFDIGEGIQFLNLNFILKTFIVHVATCHYNSISTDVYWSQHWSSFIVY